MVHASSAENQSLFSLFVVSLLVTGGAAGQNPPAASRLQPNLAGNIERPLRYTPDGQDFVIENGGGFFNRPLYGGNTAFRADAGDQPEFSLYLPGHGGNLRFGIRTSRGAKWLHETARITARYRPGTMLYEMRDPLLGSGAVLRIHAIALHQTDGLAVRIEADGLMAPVELIAAYGRLSGKRGARDGDIGTEAVPIGEYFQLKPESCQDNRFLLGPGSTGAFTLRAKAATIAGLMPPDAVLALADARHWTSLAGSLASARPAGVGSHGSRDSAGAPLSHGRPPPDFRRSRGALPRPPRAVGRRDSRPFYQRRGRRAQCRRRCGLGRIARGGDARRGCMAHQTARLARP